MKSIVESILGSNKAGIAQAAMDFVENGDVIRSASKYKVNSKGEIEFTDGKLFRNVTIHFNDKITELPNYIKLADDPILHIIVVVHKNITSFNGFPKVCKRMSIITDRGADNISLPPLDITVKSSFNIDSSYIKNIEKLNVNVDVPVMNVGVPTGHHGTVDINCNAPWKNIYIKGVHRLVVWDNPISREVSKRLKDIDSAVVSDIFPGLDMSSVKVIAYNHSAKLVADINGKKWNKAINTRTW